MDFGRGFIFIGDGCKKWEKMGNDIKNINWKKRAYREE